jgi:hypothetical protein
MTKQLVIEVDDEPNPFPDAPDLHPLMVLFDMLQYAPEEVIKASLPPDSAHLGIEEWFATRRAAVIRWYKRADFEQRLKFGIDFIHDTKSALLMVGLTTEYNRTEGKYKLWRQIDD